MDHHSFRKMFFQVLGDMHDVSLTAVTFLACASNALDFIPIVADRVFCNLKFFFYF